eukprot:CAMPEP_0185595542 /NCGR_PEP_ID=MMETSP0434-20130131/78802_1 /TAXON_ID=626734 ORGANISM="Favella taraikaensis, Strain Fe Narragansett Bay" /NCGR_SAMPLE_ID=MMETSP0434 /ASSEMBLY_ACC=CAM_ASM_000379 /LENGTH=75 /DNA_ID=CAMNT_0028223627 /DNA_START=21 /DNA_END=248 /DNA_ORIENTATION=-
MTRIIDKPSRKEQPEQVKSGKTVRSTQKQSKKNAQNDSEQKKVKASAFQSNPKLAASSDLRKNHETKEEQIAAKP